MNLFTLAGTILVDNQKANESISKTGKESEGLMTKVGKGIKTVAGIGAAVGGAVAAGGAALYGMATKTAETTDRIDKLSQKIGMSREAFQEFDFICSQSGMSVEKLQGGFKTLQTTMVNASDGNEKAKETFSKLGLSMEDVAGKSPEEVFKMSITALQGMDEGAEKSRLSMDLFGKAGQEMAPMLNGAVGSIDEMAAKAHELGLIMGDEAIDAGVAFTDQMDQLKRSFSVVVANVGAEVMPIMQKFAGWILDHMPQIQAIISVAFDVIGKVVSGAVEIVQWLIDAFGKLFESSGVTSEGLSTIWNNVKDMFTEVFNNILELLQAWIGAFQSFWDKWGDTITLWATSAWNNIKIIFDTAFKIINDLLKIFTALFTGDWKALWEGVKKLISDIWDDIKSLCSNTLDGIVQLLKNIVPNMLQAGKDMFNGVWDGLKSVWGNISNWVSDKVSWLTDKLMFWRKSEKEMSSSSSGNSRKVDGSHRNGLNYVPYDGYIAELHSREMVLTEDEADEYRNARSRGGSTNNITFIINSPTGNPKEISREIQSDLDVHKRALGGM